MAEDWGEDPQRQDCNEAEMYVRSSLQDGILLVSKFLAFENLPQVAPYGRGKIGNVGVTVNIEFY
jgi:hypothetical protein